MVSRNSLSSIFYGACLGAGVGSAIIGSLGLASVVAPIGLAGLMIDARTKDRGESPKFMAYPYLAALVVTLGLSVLSAKTDSVNVLTHRSEQAAPTQKVATQPMIRSGKHI